MNEYRNLFRLDGRCALIVGGTGGLGSAIAEGFLHSGAKVAVAGRNPQKAAGLAEIAKSENTVCNSYAVNVLDELSIARMLDSIEKELGAVDILVNSAGMNKLMPAEAYDEAAFDAVMDLNVKGVHLVTKAVGARMMIPRKCGRILNLSSVKGTLGASENYIAYCASKGAVNMYTKQLACEWAKHGITANAIAPTFVRTEINAFQLDDPVFYNKLIERIPLGRIGQAKDIAAAAIYLSSDAAAFVTGQILMVDGGLTAIQ